VEVKGTVGGGDIVDVVVVFVVIVVVTEQQKRGEERERERERIHTRPQLKKIERENSTCRTDRRVLGPVGQGANGRRHGSERGAINT